MRIWCKKESLVRKGSLSTLFKQSFRGTLKIVRDLKIHPNASEALDALGED